MPKKDTAAAVVGMLSTAGTRTRRISESAPAEPSTPPAVTVTEDGPASISTLSASASAQIADAVAPPRTLRLRPATAQRLRQAWMQAKRDDVFLTAQDFASNLLDEALTRHQRRPAART